MIESMRGRSWHSPARSRSLGVLAVSFRGGSNGRTLLSLSPCLSVYSASTKRIASLAEALLLKSALFGRFFGVVFFY
jgi:hypothetical protein